ncbi:MAG TPA: LPXTG cell wall anchor domain-containing protein, partial [Roseiflexaceae bacterium]|nr:LPXTG cell wall anchor domain-containing protein [Roseiflexaceae bacterium]
AVPPTATTGRREESEDEGGSPAATPEPTATPAPPTAAPELPTATPADVPTGGRAAVPPARLPNTGMDDGSAPALLALGVALILLGLTFARWRRREGAEEKSVSRW